MDFQLSSYLRQFPDENGYFGLMGACICLKN
jgi:hypothetical protein